ncbi:MAG TPA: hypothetical protein VI603_13070 [Saprospiraceae bacterium]|nr:hypothetical protein [Saprospiraceae bacterium]
MKSILFAILPACAILALSCGKSAPSVEADLIGYELTQVKGSDFYIASKMKDTMKIQEGYVLDGRKNGLWTDFYVDGRISLIQHFVDGKLHGPSLNLDNRGQITAQAEYEDGVLDGIKASYKFGRPQEEIPYVNGKIHGVMKKYYTNNKLMEEAEYKDNVQDGYYRHYNEEGVMDLEYVYKKGEKVSGGIVPPPEIK